MKLIWLLITLIAIACFTSGLGTRIAENEPLAPATILAIANIDLILAPVEKPSFVNFFRTVNNFLAKLLQGNSLILPVLPDEIKNCPVSIFLYSLIFFFTIFYQISRTSSEGDPLNNLGLKSMSSH
ncbi:MAG: hypothetical protein ACM3X9_06885 [Bacillota bacterium]